MPNRDDSHTAFHRDVTGELASCQSIDAGVARIELLGRRSSGRIVWRYRQPNLALFWFRSGIKSMALEVDGQRVRSSLDDGASFALIPPSTAVTGEFSVDERCEYAVAFFDPRLVARRLRLAFERPLLGFRHARLQQGFEALCAEAAHPDSVFGLCSEGWAMQTIGQLARIAGISEPLEPLDAFDSPEAQGSGRGVFTPAGLRRVREHVEAHLSQRLTTAELAQVAGLSTRHFMRAFQQRTGLTPHRFVHAARIARARELLADTALRVTDIALECGFAHSQHFSVAFKKTTGSSAREFRNAG